MDKLLGKKQQQQQKTTDTHSYMNESHIYFA